MVGMTAGALSLVPERQKPSFDGTLCRGRVSTTVRKVVGNARKLVSVRRKQTLQVRDNPHFR